MQMGKVIGSKLSIWAELKNPPFDMNLNFYWLWSVLMTHILSNTLPAAKNNRLTVDVVRYNSIIKCLGWDFSDFVWHFSPEQPMPSIGAILELD